MLLQLKAYLTVILVTLLLVVSGYAYYSHKENVRLAVELDTYMRAAADNLKAKETADESCTASLEALSEHYKEQAKLEASQKVTGDAILALPTLTIKETAHAAPETPQGYADDARLSPDTMRLLDTAYCDGDKDDCAITAP